VPAAGEVARISADRFDPDAQVPVVIEGAISDWPAVKLWSPSYLTRLIGDVRLTYKVSPTSAHPNFHAVTLPEMFATGSAPFREFVSLTMDGTGRVLFTGDSKFVLRCRDGVTTIDPELGPLLDDVHMPPLFAREALYTVWAWFSGRGGRTWLHYDNNGCHNLNAQITGSKTCVLFDPSEVDRLALWPRGTNPAVNCSQIDVAAPDLAQFPAFAEARAWSARLDAGDLLFIPAWWLHAFEHVDEFNANINFWWKPSQAVENAVSRHHAAVTP
jgi:lysine-specific demethylase 8